MLYLYCGNKKVASDLLNDNNKNNLALLVSQSNPEINRDCQILDQNLKEIVGEDFKGIIDIISGRQIYNNSLSWKCYLGSILWYKTRSVTEAMSLLTQVDENGNKPNEDSFKETDFLAYKILNLYASKECDTLCD